MFANVARYVISYLVAQALAGDDSDFIADTLVGLEVESQARVVALDDHLQRISILSTTSMANASNLSGLLHGLGTDATA